MTIAATSAEAKASPRPTELRSSSGRLATGEQEGGFRELLPEFMYFAVLPYFGAEMAAAEMQAAKA